MEQYGTVWNSLYQYVTTLHQVQFCLNCSLSVHDVMSCAWVMYTVLFNPGVACYSPEITRTQVILAVGCDFRTYIIHWVHMAAEEAMWTCIPTVMQGNSIGNLLNAVRILVLTQLQRDDNHGV